MTTILRQSIFFAVALAAWIPCALHAEPIPVDGYAAMIDNRVITVSDVLEVVQPVERQLREVYTGEDLATRLQEAYREALKSLVDRALILEDFERQEGDIPPRMVDERVEELINERFNGNRAALLAALSEGRVTPEEWRRQLKEQMIIGLLRRQEVVSRISVSPREVRDLYDERIDKFHVPEMVQVRMIVLNKGTTPEDEAAKRQQAQQVLDLLVGGEDMAALAREHSEGSRAARGGDWGWIDPSILNPLLVAVVQSLEPGQYSEAIDTGDALYIIRVEARRNASVIPFEEARKDLEEELRREASSILYEAWIDRLRGQHFVRLYEPELDGP